MFICGDLLNSLIFDLLFSAVKFSVREFYIIIRKSIANSIAMHAMWNFVMVTDILHITTEQGSYGNPIFSIIIPSASILLTGAGFGVEASLVAMVGYACICVMALWGRRK